MIEKDKEIRRLKDESQEKLQSFQIDRDGLSKAAKSEAREAERVISGLNARVEAQKRLIDELHGKFAEKVNRKAIRQQLGSYLEEGEQLKWRCLNKEDVKLLTKDANQWARQVAAYLVAKFDTSYGMQFVHPPAPQPIGHDVPPENDNLWRALDSQVGVLRKFIAEWKD